MRSENQSTRAKTPKNRAEKQQSQPTCDHGSGNQTPAILVEGECHSKNDDENENDSNDMKSHDLAMLLLPHRFVEHEQAFAPFTCIHIARTRVQVTDYNFLLQWKNAKNFWSKIIFQGH